MSGLETAAAVIGITDVAIKGILGLYEFVQRMEEAPDDVKKIQAEVGALVGSLASIQNVPAADSDVQDVLKRIGLATSVNNCGAACESMQADLTKWTRRGADHLVSKLQVASNRSSIKKNLAAIESAKGTVVLAVSTGTFLLSIKEKSSDDTQARAQAERLQVQIKDLTDEARQARLAAHGALIRLDQDMDDSEDPTPEERLVIQDLQETRKSYEKYWASCGVAFQEVRQSSGLTQSIGDVFAGKKSEVFVGMPKEVVAMVNSQNTGSVKGEEKSKVKVGIY